MTVVVVSLASVVLSVGWHDGAWKWQLPIGIPVSFVLTLLTGVAVHVFNLVPADFPVSFYLWAWLLWFSVVIIVLGWTRAHWLLRTFSVVALVFCVIAAFTAVNQTYDYYPTLARLLGKNAANFTDLPALQRIRDEYRRTRRLPTHGETITVTIAPTVSKFQAQQAYVYLPPIWFKNPEPQLPVIASPTYENDDAQQTVSQLYGGSKADYEAHNPVTLLTGGRFAGTAGYFTAGQQDPQPLAAAHQLAHLAKQTGMQVASTHLTVTIPSSFWAAAFKTSLPWLSWHLGLTPPPKELPATCDPPIP